MGLQVFLSCQTLLAEFLQTTSSRKEQLQIPTSVLGIIETQHICSYHFVTHEKYSSFSQGCNSCFLIFLVFFSTVHESYQLQHVNFMLHGKVMNWQTQESKDTRHSGTFPRIIDEIDFKRNLQVFCYYSRSCEKKAVHETIEPIKFIANIAHFQTCTVMYTSIYIS